MHVSAIVDILPGNRGTYIYIFGGYVLLGHCSRQQISEKMKGTYFRRGTYLRGFTATGLWLATLTLRLMINKYRITNQRKSVRKSSFQCMRLPPVISTT